MIHELKVKQEYFDEIMDGTKTFELRKDDRCFEVGDYLGLNEVDGGQHYTGNVCIVRVLGTYSCDDILRTLGLPNEAVVHMANYVLLSISPPYNLVQRQPTEQAR